MNGPETIDQQIARGRAIAEANGIPAPRTLSMCLHAAGVTRPRVAPEVDLSPTPWMADAYTVGAFFEPECMEHLEKVLAARGPRIVTPENDFDLAVRSEGGIILPGGSA